MLFLRSLGLTSSTVLFTLANLSHAASFSDATGQHRADFSKKSDAHLQYGISADASLAPLCDELQSEATGQSGSRITLEKYRNSPEVIGAKFALVDFLDQKEKVRRNVQPAKSVDAAKQKTADQVQLRRLSLEFQTKLAEVPNNSEVRRVEASCEGKALVTWMGVSSRLGKYYPVSISRIYTFLDPEAVPASGITLNNNVTTFFSSNTAEATGNALLKMDFEEQEIEGFSSSQKFEIQNACAVACYGLKDSIVKLLPSLNFLDTHLVSLSGARCFLKRFEK